MTHVDVPMLYSWLNHVIQVATVSMAALALVRLRPARRRAYGSQHKVQRLRNSGFRSRG
jgi:hypothetical protein